MQLENATSLELRMHETCIRCESELPASHLATEIAVSLSEGVNAVQRHRLMIIELRDALASAVSFNEPARRIDFREQQRIREHVRDVLRRKQEYYFQ
ncbi:MAG: hypothetical protein KGL39_32780 [Patescibacteria group bacterium]|nr:hypothetical protein [Patescibacteria group bacterium]